ncbi:hypothetical protein GCM10023215_52540 [Pseudonocardia yuanmonensis]|uniref:Excreted virulence factor EspC, type VII ESX diderm n=1 Tax=Pseudonocardia yuanmonensis TaxID=1095914 RepID=A0ABP8XFU8_9PSEU
MSAVETCKYLTPDLLTVLASLHGVSRSIAEASIQLLPFGSRSALEALDLAKAGPAIDAEGHRSLLLTEFAYEVMAAAKELADDCPAAASDWTAEADEVARMVAARQASS